MPRSDNSKNNKRHHPYNKKDNFKRAPFNRSMRKNYKNNSGVTYEGFHSRVVYSEPKTTIDRESRFLTHLATALKTWYWATCRNPEIDVQIALFDGEKYIISSNADATAVEAYDRLVEQTAARFFRQVATVAAAKGRKMTGVDAYRTERHALKLGEELEGERQGGAPLIGHMTAADGTSTLEKEGAAIAVRFNAYDEIGRDFYDFLVGTDKGIAILTSGGNTAHAEQKILLALSKAAVTNHDILQKPVVFAGTFRPCRGCFESLSIVQKYVFPNLQFGVRPGHFWQSTTPAHEEILKVCKPFIKKDPTGEFDEGGRMRNLTDRTHRPKLRRRDGTTVEDTNYDSESDSDLD